VDRERLNQISDIAVDCAFRVHKALGPGLLESAYKACLAIELAEAGLFVEVEVPVPLVYKGQQVSDIGYRLDLLIERELVIEVKSVDGLAPVHFAQLLSYLRLSDRRLGYLMNFNTALLKNGIKRVANNF
jgi:GxxExxY protein